MKRRQILVDAREFSPALKTGIARFLEGFLMALSRGLEDTHILVALNNPGNLPERMAGKDNLAVAAIPKGFFRSELVLSRLSQRGFDLLISPYSKLPLFGTGCPSIHTVHDIIGLTRPFLNSPFRRNFDCWRLKTALRKAALTWYVSSWSLRETQKRLGTAGTNPRVRPNGIDVRFDAQNAAADPGIRALYGLDSGYVLVLGNGKPHKNLAVLLEIADQMKRYFVLAGVSKHQRHYWSEGHATPNIRWFEQLPDPHLPAIIRGAFCLMLPSKLEGYGYPPLEAMACGVPAVVSDIPVLRETTGGNALYADPDKSADWMEALKALETDRFYRRQSRRGLDWAQQFKGERGWAEHLTDVKNLLVQQAD